MKKIYIALAVLATAALTSCQEEKSFNGEPVGDGDVAFVLKAGPSTKAAELDSPVTKGINVPIGRAGNMDLYLEETITDLGYVSPETRGVPVFTENVGKLYSNKLFVHAGGDFGDATFETNGLAGDGWRYSHHYGSKDPWPESGTVDFFLRMPSDMTGVTFGESAYASGAKTTFSYTSPVTAAAQTDIIFTGITLDEATHKKNLPDGTPVTFYHALTAVKFAIGNSATELSSKGIAITKIEFTGLLNTGTCTVDPTATTKVTWSNTSATVGEGGAANVISQTFTADENVVTFDKDTDKNSFGDSFFSAGTSQNVNKADASYTFWLIPQKFDSSNGAVLRISYTMSGKDEYLDITLKDILKNVEWKAGELRTFTIKLDEVNVKISDTVTIPSTANAENGYKGSTKTNIKIQNTGNTPAFIRAAIVGQWLDPDGNPVFGFTDKVNNLYLVESWYEDQFVNTSTEWDKLHGRFYDLPGYKGAASFKADTGASAGTDGITPGWQLCTDGYYYYTKIVEPNDYTASDLFTKYETILAPKAELAGKVLETAQMYFTLEIATQAITAVKMDGHEGSRYTWKEAWKNATGTEPVAK